MTKIYTCVFLVILLSVSMRANAAWTGKRDVKYLKVQSNGTFLRLTGFLNNDPSITCGSQDFFLYNTEENYQEKTSFLLAAFMSGKKVNISYYGCAGSHIELGSVALEEN